MDDGFAIIMLVVVAGFIGFIVGVIVGEVEMQAQAIQRGYALYCPSSGDYAWQGECK
jgi:hypothetical protein